MEQIDFEAIEVAARRVALDLMARAVQRRFDQDHSDRDGASLPCPCGQTARYQGRLPKTFTISVGRITLQRA